ncbi:MAG: TIGR02449 family protein [Gammaproteobacteria bacterium]|mgnify:CR=1 FL=1|nr:TIGR02449 family protein [Gammaproteobacteria bacterium]
MQDEDLKRLEMRIDELIAICAQLKDENRELREQKVEFSAERENLLEKQDQARIRVEKIINRLKSLEKSE